MPLTARRRGAIYRLDIIILLHLTYLTWG